MKLKQVIDHFGGMIHVASALEVSLQTVYHWKEKGSIPYNRQCQIEVVTSGKLKAERTRKDANRKQS